MTATDVKTNTPALRFPEFSGEWEEKKLDEIAKFSKGRGVSKSDITPDGATECIRYGQLYTHYGETIKNVISRTNVDHKELILSEYNDIIIPASGESEIDIATASCVLKSGVALGGDLNIIKTENNGVYLSYYLNNRKKKEIASMAQGIAVVHLYSSQLKTLNIKLPTLPEQQKIAAFLTAVDTRIDQLTRKKTLLAQYKKGIMQQLFSQTLRFKDDNGEEFPEWEEKTLGEFTLSSAFGPRFSSELYSPEGNVVTLRTTDMDSDGNIDYSKSPRADIDVEQLKEHVLQKDDLVISRSGTIGVTGVFNSYVLPVVPGAFLIRFRLNGVKICPQFVRYLFNSEKGRNKIESLSAGGVQKNLTGTSILNLQTHFPSLPEQQKIAAFLSAIDAKINAVEQQLTQTKTYKKGLLQQLFV